jgi:uncharacterized protein (TIGR03435 family)
MTGLTGGYEVSLELNLADIMAAARAAQGGGGPGPATPSSAAATAPEASDPGGAGMTVYASVEKAGLKLEKRKAVVEQLVVDSVEKTPTEN